MSPHLKFLHMTQNFSTDNVRGVRDKYQVWLHLKTVTFSFFRPQVNVKQVGQEWFLT